MSKVLVDRELLERAMYAKDGKELIYANRELRAILDQPAEAEVEALMKWKQTAEYWYGQYRLVKYGESPAEYPTEGQLDDWHNSCHSS